MSRSRRRPSIRLQVHVEGQTEESFVNQVLAPHLYQRGYASVWAGFIGSPRRRGGGITSWMVARREILRRLNEDTDCFATTMVDYYGLPTTWPVRTLMGGCGGWNACQRVSAHTRRLLGRHSGFLEIRLDPAWRPLG